MIVNVLGIGKEIEGEYQGHSYRNRTVFVSYEDNTRAERGLVCERFKVSSKVSDLKDIVVGTECDFVFNRFGKIVDVRRVD